ncbi:hypothetical protein LKL35_01070 [Streptomyces sp. ET3-23]|uniref:hypothetical protein n=1 Tax=Streptomyces sp. ET3-23 TaxID=2885643 RepID=UPI001D129EF7|nr:hypothetical protein [Streptomyces sp. ET3-23]MCC2274041.1 hypothetical protein [Streptomyces sp. ET3-23]
MRRPATIVTTCSDWLVHLPKYVIDSGSRPGTARACRTDCSWGPSSGWASA